MNCQFVALTRPGYFYCVECKKFFRFPGPGEPQRECEGRIRCVAQDPEAEARARQGAERLGVTWEDAAHYAQALARWTAAGWPERSDEEVKRIFETRCRPCDAYVGNDDCGRCRECRCRVNLGPALVNKIKMATEECPRRLWQGE